MEVVLNIERIIGNPSALTVEQGELLYIEMDLNLTKAEKVILDFEGIESIITPFLNASIGKLYGKYSTDELKEKLDFRHYPAGTARKINMVIENAKQFYANKDGYTKIVDQVLA